jgi:predicted nucleic acid-binding protein
VLLYAVDSASAHHEPSRSWLDASLAGSEAVGLAWIVHPNRDQSPHLPNPTSADEATAQAETWLGAPAVLAQRTPRHAGLLRDTGTAGNLTTAAHLAALAIEHGADVVSYDRDFARFPGIRHRLPG